MKVAVVVKKNDSSDGGGDRIGIGEKMTSTALSSSGVNSKATAALTDYARPLSAPTYKT